MSDPVTNVEIEDVLSSIRRLVSDGDKARTRDPAPVQADADPAPKAREDSGKNAESKPDKFVLTPSLMVVVNESAPDAEQNVVPDLDDVAEDAHDDDEDDQDAGWVEELPDEPEAAHNDFIHHTEEEDTDETLSDFEADEIDDDAEAHSEQDVSEADDAAEDGDTVTEGAVDADADDESADMVWGSVDEARKIGLAALPKASDDKVNLGKTFDRSSLIASIAELEAAVSKDVQDFEPDGSESADDVMGETIAWPGSVKRNTDNAQDAEEADQPEADIADVEPDDAEAVEFEHRSDTPEDAKQEFPVEHTEDEDDDYGDDDLDGLMDAGAVNLDEDALRALVSEIVREELTGPMGERITRNVRKLVRREIYRILSSQEFD